MSSGYLKVASPVRLRQSLHEGTVETAIAKNIIRELEINKHQMVVCCREVML